MNSLGSQPLTASLAQLTPASLCSRFCLNPVDISWSLTDQELLGTNVVTICGVHLAVAVRLSLERSIIVQQCFSNLSELPCPQSSPMVLFLLCQTHICDGAAHSTKIYVKFLLISLVSGYWHGIKVKQRTSEQNVSVEVPQKNTSKIDLSTQKTSPWEMCSLNVKGGAYVAEDLGINCGQTLCGAGVKCQQNRGDKLFRRDVVKAFMKRCTVRALGKAFMYCEARKDCPGISHYFQD